MASDQTDMALLVVLGEPLNEEQPPAILQRLTEGLSAWNSDKNVAKLNAELLDFLKKDVEAEPLESGGFVLRASGSSIYIEFVIAPSVPTLHSSLIHFLTTSATYRHIVHAGPIFLNTGSWILRDGTLSFHDFARILHRPDVVTALTETTADSVLTVSCFPEGEWNDQGIKHHGLDHYGQISVGISDGNTKLDPSCSKALQGFVERFAQFAPLAVAMPPSDLVGSIRFRRPTIYIFPAGQGDAALFGVDGFLLLMDGGFQRKTCFWDFVRHVDNLDAILISGINSSNLFGQISFLAQLASTGCAPKVCHALGTVPEVGKGPASQEPKNPLLISLYDEGAKIFERLGQLGLKSQTCTYSPPMVTPKYPKYPESIVLFEKVGEGRLEMYVLNPIKESKEYAEFVETWKKRAPRLIGSKFSTRPGSDASDYSVPLTNRSSMAVLLVWHPSEPEERIVRVLYPGSCPQEKVLSGMEKLKCWDFLKYPYCTAALLEKKPGTLGLAGMKAAMLTKKPMGKTAAELMAEGLKLGAQQSKALAAALLPVSQNARLMASPPSPTQVQSPAIDSDLECGITTENGSTPAESHQNPHPGFAVEAESSVAYPYESVDPSRSTVSSQDDPASVDKYRNQEAEQPDHVCRPHVKDVRNEWGEPLGLPPVSAKKPASESTKSTGGSKSAPKSSASAVKRTPTKSADSSSKQASPAPMTAKPPPAPARSPSPKPQSPISYPPVSKPPTKPTSLVAKTGVRRGIKSGGALKKQSSAISYTTCYVDLAYVPHQGNPYYCNADFFKYIRSKYYVFSSLNPPKETFDALLAGKRSWNAQDESVTIIPTYDSDTLSLWMSIRKDELAFENVDVSPACSRCSVNLEEHTGATCAAYRLEL